MEVFEKRLTVGMIILRVIGTLLCVLVMVGVVQGKIMEYGRRTYRHFPYRDWGVFFWVAVILVILCCGIYRGRFRRTPVLIFDDKQVESKKWDSKFKSEWDEIRDFSADSKEKVLTFKIGIRIIKFDAKRLDIDFDYLVGQLEERIYT